MVRFGRPQRILETEFLKIADFDPVSQELGRFQISRVLDFYPNILRN